jgi:hypothetical protein
MINAYFSIIYVKEKLNVKQKSPDNRRDLMI